jgi:hypothetical protein
MKTIYLSIFSLALLFLSIQAQAQCNREAIVDDYTINFLGSSVTSAELGWTGNADSCDAGNISALAQQRTLDRINYYRRLCGVPDIITFDPVSDSLCREAALMMKANNKLSHTPDTSFSCYTQGGDNAAGSSNLALGAHSSGAIALYMRDPGAGNTAAGHRRWILYPRASVFGHGSTDRSSALWVFGNRVTRPPLDFVAYPAKGFFPAPLVYPRWSFSIPSADFTNATVTMTNPLGNAVTLNIVHTNGGFGDRTIVWEPDMTAIDLANPIDQTYHIEIKGVVGAPFADYAYDVVIIQPTHPPTCAMTTHWDNDSCACIPDNTSIGGELSADHVKMVFDRTDSRLNISFPTMFVGNTSFQMVDMNGKLLEKRNWENVQAGYEESLNISQLPQGIYVIEIRQGNNRRSLKVMK